MWAGGQKATLLPATVVQFTVAVPVTASHTATVVALVLHAPTFGTVQRTDRIVIELAVVEMQATSVWQTTPPDHIARRQHLRVQSRLCGHY